MLSELAEKNAGTVFATDSMVAAIMCAARSVYSWDRVVTKRDGKVFFDKRDEGNFDLLTVSETAQDAITDDKDNINGVQQLSRESTAANFNYSQQVLGDEKPMAFGKADPLGGGRRARGGVPLPQVDARRRRHPRHALRARRRASELKVRPCCSP